MCPTQNDIINIAFDAKSLSDKHNGTSSYISTLLSEISMVEKKHKFFILHNSANIFNNNVLGYKQHNFKQINHFLSFFLSGTEILHMPAAETPGSNIRAKKITTVHDISDIIHPEFSSTPGQLTAEIKRQINESSVIIVPSQSTKNDPIKYLSVKNDRIKVIPHGIKAVFKPEHKKQIDMVKVRYGIKRPFILFAGPLLERKNIKGILEAYSLIKFESPPDLVLFGKDRLLRYRLKELIKEYELENYVKYLGEIPEQDLPSLYSGAEFLISPSFYEGFGLTLLEAMSCGCPVITSGNSAILETVGEAALLTDPFDAEKISVSMRKLLHDTEMRTGLKKKSLAQASKFSARKMAKDTLIIYEEAAKK